MAKFLFITIFLVIFASITFTAQAKPTTNADEYSSVGQFVVPGLAILAVLAHKDKQGAWQLGKAYAATIAAVYILKPLVNRKRPSGGNWSFPSGHTASAFAGAAFLQRRYGWRYGIPAYAMASAVGAMRVLAEKHWTTDVIAGAALAIGANYIFTTPFKHKVMVLPFFDGDAAGLDLETPL